MRCEPIRSCDCYCPLHPKIDPRLENPVRFLPPAVPPPANVILFRRPGEFGQSNVPFFNSDRFRLNDGVSAWGYSGSGPHSLAADILQWFGMTDQEARRWAGELVIEFLGFLPKEGATIPKERIFKVIEEIRSGTRKHPSESGESAALRMEINARNYRLAKGGF